MQATHICEDCGTKVPTEVPTCPNCGLNFSAQSEWEERVDQSIGEAFPLPPEDARHGKAETLTSDMIRQAQPAGFSRRFAAIFVDGVLVNVFSYGAMAALGIAFGITGDIEDPDPSGALILAFVFISMLAPILYFVLMESSSMQATLGKKLVGIKVTDLQGQRIGFGRALGRLLCKILSAMTLYIGFMMAGWTQKKQALHDMLAGTLVVVR